MRENKFRYWINKKPHIFSLKDIEGANCCSEIISGNYENRDEFIGLKDKNKKEIFEGDILNWDNECILLIKWFDEQAGFYYEILTQKDENTVYDIRLYRSEESAKIIGNIHENPELLKKELKIKNGK